MSRHEVVDFCHTHYACSDGRDWALNCDSMHEVWLTARPDWLVWVATRQGVLNDKDLRLFTCWCVRQFWHLLTDERFKNAVIVAEKYARGEATEADFAAVLAAQAAERGGVALAQAVLAERGVGTLAVLAAALVQVETWTAREAQAEYLRERFNPFLKEAKK